MGSAQVLTEKPPGFGDSRWAVVAGGDFLVLGILIAVFGVTQIAAGLAYDDTGGIAMGYNILAMIVGGMVVAIGILHVGVGRSIWRHQAWARVVGIVSAALGAMLGAYLLPSAFNPVIRSNPMTGEPISSGPDLLAITIVLSGIAYVIALIGLIVGGRHFRRRDG